MICRAAVLASALAAILGCAAPPLGPLPNQEWISLEDYAKRRASGVAETRPLPVVVIPQGTEVHLNLSQKTGWPPPWMTEEHRPAFEPVEDTVIKSRAARTVYLDLENVLTSTDKHSWYVLGYDFLPAPPSVRLILGSDPKSQVDRQVDAFVHVWVLPAPEPAQQK